MARVVDRAAVSNQECSGTLIADKNGAAAIRGIPYGTLAVNDDASLGSFKGADGAARGVECAAVGNGKSPLSAVKSNPETAGCP